MRGCRDVQEGLGSSVRAQPGGLRQDGGRRSPDRRAGTGPGGSQGRGGAVPPGGAGGRRQAPALVRHRGAAVKGILVAMVIGIPVTLLLVWALELTGNPVGQILAGIFAGILGTAFSIVLVDDED